MYKVNNNMSLCPICLSDNVKQLFYRENVPINQNLLMHTKNDAINVTRKHLDINICCSCGFIYNKLFDSSSLLYGEDYNNDQTYSPLFHDYVHDIIKYIINDCKIENKNILEIGCGKGYFLKELCKNGNNNGVGYDPSYVESDNSIMNEHVIFKKQLYELDNENNIIDVIICRHVIEHIQHPMVIFDTIIKSIKKLITNKHNIRIFIETPDVKWILENVSFFDFFYEHCSYFSEESITTSLKISGFNVNNIKHIFNEQYMLIDAYYSDNSNISNNSNIINNNNISDKNNINNNIINSYLVLKLSERYVKSENCVIKKYTNKIQELSSKGKISIWGAGAKGVTFVNMFDSKCKYIDCVVDINPNKQECYIPGTGHLIINYQDLTKRNINFVIVMNSNYYNEILNILKQSNIDITLIDIKNI